ncbi:dihydropteroate synthase [Dietzia sp.]|uniref:dihydropteroate synthase n=1 Tax=Dietzia sp. TaxID=1871616 RepID=UPI002FDA1A85
MAEPTEAARTLCGRPVASDRALVMSIVNRTPDSFFDKGATFADEPALRRVDEAASAGADIVDIGGVKAGPGETVDAAEEIRRVVPFIEAVHERHPGLLISVDTWRSEVAAPAIEAGAAIINDTWAGYDENLVHTAAEGGAGFVCSHTGSAEPRTRPYRVGYEDVVAAVREELASGAERALAAGIAADAVIVDPTHDFGKNTYHGLELLRDLSPLVELGFPVLMALSNKDFIGETLDADVDNRGEGTLAASAVALWQGARILRCHDIVGTRRIVDMVASIQGTRPPARVVRGLA